MTESARTARIAVSAATYWSDRPYSYLVPSALEACRKKGALGAEILSSGFSETGTPEGIARIENIEELLNGIKDFTEKQKKINI